MNKIQFELTPQRSTNDAFMTVRKFVTDGLRAEDIVVIVSLDVKVVLMPPVGLPF